MYSGIWLPIIAPFRHGKVDIDALQYLADTYLSTQISPGTSFLRRLMFAVIKRACNGISA
jgi:hypothetical protein